MGARDAPSEMMLPTPDQEIESVLPNEVLASLDEPIELKAGMVFAVETYCPATDGISAARIEEEVILTPSGAKVISLYPAEELPIANPY